MTSGIFNTKELFSRPVPYLTTRVKRVDGVAYFSPLNVYDYVLFGSNPEFLKLNSDITTFQAQKSSSSISFLLKFEGYELGFVAAQRLNDILTAKNLQAMLQGLDPIALHSPIPYQSKSSLSHLGIDYRGSVEFLMVPAIKKGDSMAKTMSKHNTTSIYGPATLKILQGLGYATHNDRNVLQLAILDTFGTGLYDPAESELIPVIPNPQE